MFFLYENDNIEIAKLLVREAKCIKILVIRYIEVVIIISMVSIDPHFLFFSNVMQNAGIIIKSVTRTVLRKPKTILYIISHLTVYPLHVSSRVFFFMLVALYQTSNEKAY